MDQPPVNPNTAAGNVAGPAPEKVPAAQPEQPARAPAPETAPAQPERGREQLANPEQRGPSQGVALPPVQPPAVPTGQPAPTAPTPTAPASDSPLIADDVDVIEMEWVNKAKKIIKDTQNDPHAQEEAVEQLQLDYLKKRYGKEIKKTRSG